MTAAMRDVIDRMARAGRPPLHSLTPDEARAAYEKGANVLEVPLRALHQVQDRTLPARDGVPLPVRLYRPTSEPGLPLSLIHI